MTMSKNDDDICDFIADVFEQSKAKGVVVGVSGGIDSAVVLSLCVRSLGAQKVMGILMPSMYTPDADLEDAKKLCQELGVSFFIVGINKIVEPYIEALGTFTVNMNPTILKVAKGNLAARVRANILYFVANLHNYIVAGTTDKTEAFVGYFTKYGDGACDFEPIIHLTKTEVRTLGYELGLSSNIVQKKSSPRLWDEHMAEDELQMSYDELDRILTINKNTEHKRAEIPSLLNWSMN